jgi:phosphoglycolate phosphatase-like HAD superfamily hydrolase
MRVCLFDIDGTLLLSGGAGKAAMEQALLSEFGVTKLRGSVPFSGRTDRAIARDLLQLHGVADAPENWPRLRDAYLRHLPDCLASHQGRVLPGITALLEHLGKQGDVAVGLLTGNVRDGARLKLEHFNLFHHFAFGGFGDHHLERNDVAREALADACRHCNGTGQPPEIWVIGDTPLDVCCARAIGARAVAVATGWHSLVELAATQPDLLVVDLADPAAFLALLD